MAVINMTSLIKITWNVKTHQSYLGRLPTIVPNLYSQLKMTKVTDQLPSLVGLGEQGSHTWEYGVRFERSQVQWL